MVRKKSSGLREGHGWKARAIRGMLAKFPNMKTGEVVNRLSAKGITVSASQVAGIRNRLEEKAEEAAGHYDGVDTDREPLGELVCNSQNRNPNGFELYSDLRKVAELVRDIGFDRATEALKIAKELDGIFGETP